MSRRVVALNSSGTRLRKDWKMGRLVAKVPMEKVVVDDRGWWYYYTIHPEGIVYQLMGTAYRNS